ncbi:MAG: endo-1,4-beta-xylanase [Rikenellaceae bacterium]|jgi:endo-1,4-beta-xylanase|nr:endo-1,4-beta-xylanase [Rikenellaceae bacterium]
MKSFTFIAGLCMIALAGCNSTPKEATEPSLKEALKGKFYIGTALSVPYIYQQDPLADELIKYQYDAIVAENCMKMMYMQPKEGEFFWDEADRFVEYGEANGMFITGHNLVWHSQAPSWFFTDSEGKEVTREVLIERMKTHIQTVVSHYKGRIKGWDVVNEAIMEDGSWRKSKFYEIIGPDFIDLAFQFAHEADPDCELYYNDYNEWYPGKIATIVDMIKRFKENGIRIDAIGMQGHVSMTSPTIEEYRATIDAYTAAGVNVMVTELDMSALPDFGSTSANVSDRVAFEAAMNPYTAGLPEEVSNTWNNRMDDLFRLFLEKKDVLTRVTFWGVTDATSWKNDFPMPGRTDYPLPFDRDYKPKRIVYDIAEMTK